MPDIVTGGCQCGRVRFAFPRKPLAVRACWCRDCQYIATGNASITAFFDADGVSITGETARFTREATSGRTIRQHFCPHCGTPLFAADDAESGFLAVRVGALDDREVGRPASTIWTSSAPGWAIIDDRTTCWPGHPPSA